MTKTIQVTRSELYEGVWSEPMTKFAKKYGISDVALGKICRKHSIPLPRAGHWAKVAAGKQIVRPPLPGAEQSEIWIRPPDRAPRETRELRVELAHQLAIVPSELHAPQTITKPHQLTVLSRESLKAKKPDMYGLVHCRPPHGYWLAVSPVQVGRALRILDTLVKALQKAGFEIVTDKKEHELQVLILGEAIPFHMRESYAQIPIPPEKRGKGYFSPAYEYLPKGVLSIQLPRYLNEVKSSWSDGKKPLEENLAAVFEGFLIAAVRYRERSEEFAARNAEFQEREKIRAETEAELAREQKQRDALMKEAQQWAVSQQVLDYISHIETLLTSGGTEIPRPALQWLTDARTRAEQLDPTESRLRTLADDL